MALNMKTIRHPGWPYDKLAILFAERFIPALTSTVVLLLLAFSAVDANLYVLTGRPAALVLVAYAGLAAGLAAFPHIYVLHRVAMPIGLFAWMGRTGGFVELALSADADVAWRVWANAAERGLIVALLLFWHVSVVVRHGQDGTLR